MREANYSCSANNGKTVLAMQIYAPIWASKDPFLFTLRTMERFKLRQFSFASYGVRLNTPKLASKIEPQTVAALDGSDSSSDFSSVVRWDPDGLILLSTHFCDTRYHIWKRKECVSSVEIFIHKRNNRLNNGESISNALWCNLPNAWGKVALHNSYRLCVVDVDSENVTTADSREASTSMEAFVDFTWVSPHCVTAVSCGGSIVLWDIRCQATESPKYVLPHTEKAQAPLLNFSNPPIHTSPKGTPKAIWSSHCAPQFGIDAVSTRNEFLDTSMNPTENSRNCFYADRNHIFILHDDLKLYSFDVRNTSNVDHWDIGSSTHSFLRRSYNSGLLFSSSSCKVRSACRSATNSHSFYVQECNGILSEYCWATKQRLWSTQVPLHGTHVISGNQIANKRLCCIGEGQIITSCASGKALTLYSRSGENYSLPMQNIYQSYESERNEGWRTNQVFTGSNCSGPREKFNAAAVGNGQPLETDNFNALSFDSTTASFPAMALVYENHPNDVVFSDIGCRY